MARRRVQNKCVNWNSLQFLKNDVQRIIGLLNDVIFQGKKTEKHYSTLKRTCKVRERNNSSKSHLVYIVFLKLASIIAFKRYTRIEKNSLSYVRDLG